VAAAQVVVRVLDGAAVVDDSIRRPVRLTPDGYAGVAYAGAVYPLVRGDTVDVSGASWEIEDCDGFLMAGTEVPYAPAASDGTDSTFVGFSGEWSVETNRFGHYVVFNAPARVARGVVDALESAGLSVQRWDVGHRPAADGKFYDWFARLRFKGSRDECVALIEAVFHPADGPAPARSIVPESTRLEDLEAQIERLVGQVATLQERLGGSEDELAALREKFASSRAAEAKLSAALDRALAHQRATHEELVALRQAADQTPVLRDALTKLTDAEELLEFALAENATLHEQLGYVTDKAERGEDEIMRLESTLRGVQAQLEEVGEQERERRRTAQTRIAPQGGVVGFLGVAFARISLVQDSVEVLANFESPVAALRALVRLDMGDVIGKDLEGLRGWREVSKIATGISGSEDMGRIYYKPCGERVLVSVHIKQDDKEQRRHVERLRDL
jgi:hypothetical protein